MTFFDRLAGWWRSHRPKQLGEQLAVAFDDDAVTVRVLADLDAEWNQTFRWADVARVCFTDTGLYHSDLIRVQLHRQDKPVVVPLEAAGGPQFFGAICDRGLLPDEVWRRAIGDTRGGTHCWPPLEREA